MSVIEYRNTADLFKVVWRNRRRQICTRCGGHLDKPDAYDVCSICVREMLSGDLNREMMKKRLGRDDEIRRKREKLALARRKITAVCPNCCWRHNFKYSELARARLAIDEHNSRTRHHAKIIDQEAIVL